MQVTETLNEGLRRGYRIVLAASELEETVNGKLADAQPTFEMKGFRKGKVPMALLKKQFGQRLLGEAMQETIDGAMSKHFNDSGDRPAQQPDVKMTNEDWKEGDDVEVEMSYEALPTIPDVDFKAEGAKGNDPYATLGFGFEAYFRMIKCYLCLFLLFTLLSLPILGMYYTGSGL